MESKKERWKERKQFTDQQERATARRRKERESERNEMDITLKV